MEWKTRATELLGIRYPIIEGALAGIGNAELAIPVSEAGGLGMLTAWTMGTPEKLRRGIREVRSRTDRPFAVNLSPTLDPSLQAMLDVAIDERVPVIETAGSRAVDFGARVKDAGLIWIHKVQTVRHALAAQRDGADAVCIMGLEGAGLKSPLALPTLVGVALAARQVSIPLIAAGGIGDARTFLAALALGADAVLLGTVFCAVKECPLSERRKQVLVDADPWDPKWRDPILSTSSPEDVQRLKEAAGTHEVLEAAGRAEDTGIPKEAGTGALSLAIGFIDRVVTVKELIDSIIDEAEQILTSGGIGGWRLAPDPPA
jgi:nitronate monooxygenase